MGILGWVLFGIVVALFARAVMPERYPLGVVGTTTLGVIGALFAGWFGQSLGWYGPDDGLGFVVSTAGAILTISLYHAWARRQLFLKQMEQKWNNRVFPIKPKKPEKPEEHKAA